MLSNIIAGTLNFQRQGITLRRLRRLKYRYFIKIVIVKLIILPIKFWQDTGNAKPGLKDPADERVLFLCLLTKICHQPISLLLWRPTFLPPHISLTKTLRCFNAKNKNKTKLSKSKQKHKEEKWDVTYSRLILKIYN